MSESERAGALPHPALSPSEPPRTGNPLVDRALAEVAHLDPGEVAGHHDRLAAAHERLHLALDPDAPLPEPDQG